MKLSEYDGRETDHPNTEAVVQGNTATALDLYGKLKEAKGNLLFSPYSISAALAMTYAGARGNTEMQMAQALHFMLDQKRLHSAFASLQTGLDAIQEKGYILLRAANALWPRIGSAFLEEFFALTEAYYGVLITSVDYAEPEIARGEINSWVEERTENRIKDLIGPKVLNALTRLVLVNAIYFKGNWASQFDRTLTVDTPFWVTPAEKVAVPMMYQKQKFRYAESDSLQILELPYVGHDLSMVVLLPKEIDGLNELEDALTMENLARRTSGLWEQEVIVFLPRFTMSSGFRLDSTLASMGMIDAFDQGKANFSGMDGREQWLYISAAIHKAFIDVNEEGTEAAAATTVVMAAKSIPTPLPTFRADHPFLFLIRENHTGGILFLGRVVNPMPGAA